MSDQKMQNITFDEMQVGQSASLTRTLTKKDIELFALVSGDVNPAHLDEQYADDSLFRGVIGHGMWSGGLISTVLGTVMPGPGTIYMGQEMKFKAPVRIGDEITVKLTVQSKHESKPIVVFECVCMNGKGEVVVEGTAKVLAPTEKINVDRPQLPAVEIYDRDHYKKVLEQCKGLGKIRTAVVHPVKKGAIEAVKEAVDQGLITPVLIGPKARIKAAAKEAGVNVSRWEFVTAKHSHDSAAKAVSLAAKGEVEAIMRGSLSTKELIQAVIPSKSGLRTERRISHAHIMNIPTYHKPLIITDTMINIAPSLDEKIDICQNAIDLWQMLFAEKDDEKAKVALLTAIETVNSNMPATMDAACLAKMSDRNQIKGAYMDGPLAFENVISAQILEDEGIESPVAGDADILVVPNIESGNALAKQLTLLGHADASGIVLGAKVPIMLTSSKDTMRTRLLSCALALLISNGKKKGKIK